MFFKKKVVDGTTNSSMFTNASYGPSQTTYTNSFSSDDGKFTFSGAGVSITGGKLQIVEGGVADTNRATLNTGRIYGDFSLTVDVTQSVANATSGAAIAIYTPDGSMDFSSNSSSYNISHNGSSVTSCAPGIPTSVRTWTITRTNNTWSWLINGGSVCSIQTTQAHSKNVEFLLFRARLNDTATFDNLVITPNVLATSTDKRTYGIFGENQINLRAMQLVGNNQYLLLGFGPRTGNSPTIGGFLRMDLNSNSIVDSLSTTTSPALNINQVSVISGGGQNDKYYIGQTSGVDITSGPVTNQNPTAPTKLYVNESTLGAQSGYENNVKLTPGSTPVFSAIFSDPNGSDTAAKYQIQVSTDPTFTTVTHWESGATGTAMATTSQGQRSGDITYGGSALTSGVTYYWKIKFFDNNDAEGAFSANGTFAFSTLSHVLNFSSTSKDKNNNTHLGGNTIKGIGYYDRTGEAWSTPTSGGYTGWGYDGKKYENGTEILQGNVVYDADTAGVKPSQDIKGQDWTFGGGLAESVVTVTGGNLNISDTSATLSTGYTRTVPTLTSTSDFILKFRARLNSSSNFNYYGLLGEVSDGSHAFYFGLDTNAVGFLDTNNWSRLGTAIPMNTTSAFHDYELKRVGGTVTLTVDNTTSTSLADSSFGTNGVGTYFTFGTGDVNTSNVDIDYIRYQIGSSTFTTQPMAPWASESLSSTRGASDAFPLKSYLVSTDAGLNIIDAETNEMWMQFDHGTGKFLEGSTQSLRKASMQNGKLLLPRAGDQLSNGLGGLSVMDFTNSSLSRFNYPNRQTSDQNISGRNGANTFANAGTGLGTDNNVYWVSPATISGTDYAAVGMNRSFSFINLATNAVPTTYKNVSSGLGFTSPVGYLTTGGRLYAANSVSPYSVTVFNNATADSGTVEWSTAKDAQYTIANGFILDAINDLGVTTGTSTVDGTSNTLYAATPSGLSIIQEKAGDETNSTKVHYGNTTSTNGTITQKILRGSTDKILKVVPISTTQTMVLSGDAYDNTLGALTLLNPTTNAVTDYVDGNSPTPPTNTNFAEIAYGTSGYYLLGHTSGYDVISSQNVSAPTTLAASPDGTLPQSKINLTWVDTANNEDGFMVFRSTNSGVNRTSTMVAYLPADTQSYSDTTVAQGQIYFYKVFADDTR